ncbi:A24 family peptidase [Phenylobacterium aquaticum]|uniref:prepilin peptidase n=1 Tax=Phenylobacterium aquaticum TaxID=1763816 RepID=UPI0026E9D1FE|nr:A24 family peptidase [Phenylobacterium aquaticum]
MVSGLVLGSYAVTAGIRLARSEPSSGGRSHCDHCGVVLGFAQTVPVISSLMSRGACRSCGAPIDPTHLAGELAGAVIVGAAVMVASFPRSMLLAGLGLVLITASAVDLKVQRLPDPLTAAVAVLALCLMLSRSGMPWLEGVSAAAISFGLLQVVRWASSLRGGDPGLGFGDVKLTSALALWLGAATAWTVVGAALLGLGYVALTRRTDRRLPFGPMLAVAALGVGYAREAGIWPTML